MGEDLTEVSALVGALLRRLKAQQKALASLEAAEGDEDVPRLRGALAALDVELLDDLGMGSHLQAVLDGARERMEALGRRQRVMLSQELRDACEAAGRAFRRLGDNPPEFLVAPFTAVVDLLSMEAAVCYARQELTRIPARASAILDAVAGQERAFRARQLSSREELELLLGAYRAVLGRRGESMGSRVELSEILPEMAMLHQSRRFREDPLRERFAPYSRARFLWDLARLRDSRTLELGELRADLGTATGDSVKRKSRVFFLQEPNGDGQYYLSLRFVRR